MIITQYLKFNMMGFLHKFLQIYRIVTKSRHRLRTGGIISLNYFILTMYQSHTFSATTHRGFQHHGIADLITYHHSLPGTLQGLFRTGNYRYSGCNHVFTG